MFTSVVLFLLFFFLRDGGEMVTRALALVPMTAARKADLVEHLSAVMRAVAMQPAQRFQTAEEMAAALRGFDPGRPAFEPQGPPRLRLQYRGAWSYFGRDFPSRIVGPTISVLAVPAFLASAVLVILGPWMLGQILSYTHSLYSSIPSLVGG